MFVNNTVPAATIKCTADPYLEFGVAGIWEACRRDQSFISHQRSILPQHGAADWDESKKKQKKSFSSLYRTSLKETTRQKRESNFSSLLIVSPFDCRQIRKQKSGERLVKHGGSSEAFFPSWKTAHSSERGFSSKRTAVTLPILLPIKIYWEHPGNTAQLISSQLACQKQTNTAITGTRRGFLPQPFEFITSI